MGDAVYMTATVTCGWAGAVKQKLLAKRQKSKGVMDQRTEGWTDQTTDQPTDRPTDRQSDL